MSCAAVVDRAHDERVAQQLKLSSSTAASSGRGQASADARAAVGIQPGTDRLRPRRYQPRAKGSEKVVSPPNRGYAVLGRHAKRSSPRQRLQRMSQQSRRGSSRHDGLESLRIVEEERQRLARELHDETGQILTAVLFKVDSCLAELPPGTAQLETGLRDVRQMLIATTRDLHRMIYSLRPPMLSELGLIPTLEWSLNQFESQYNVRAVLDAPCSTVLPESVELALFRITQEALTNVARHAGASTVYVRLDVGDFSLDISITDDGKGFIPTRSTPGKRSRLGLRGMRERAELLGGCLKIESAPSKGTVVRATIPHSGGRADED